MAKNSLLTAFCILCQLALAPIFAANERMLPNGNYQNLEFCNAPAPTNFGVASIGSSFIALSWQPAWVGATHTLEVLEKIGPGTWAPFDTFYNIPGYSFTVFNLQSGHEYRFIIATNCNSGETSSLKAIIDGIALILDLTINGRAPELAKAVNCQNIPINYNWIGFKVNYVSDGITVENFFEFKIINNSSSNSNGLSFFTNVEVKRVHNDNPIVAVDAAGDWPTCDVSSIPGSSSFRIDRIIGGGPNREMIGWVDYSQTSGSTIKLCPDFDHAILPWKNSYGFTAYVSGKATFNHDCDRQDDELAVFDEIIVQNPFNERLNIFLPKQFSEAGEVEFSLVNNNGQVVMQQKSEFSGAQISLPMNTVKPGIFVLQIKTQNKIHRQIVIKSE